MEHLVIRFSDENVLSQSAEKRRMLAERELVREVVPKCVGSRVATPGVIEFQVLVCLQSPSHGVT